MRTQKWPSNLAAPLTGGLDKTPFSGMVRTEAPLVLAPPNIGQNFFLSANMQHISHWYIVFGKFSC